MTRWRCRRKWYWIILVPGIFSATFFYDPTTSWSCKQPKTKIWLVQRFKPRRFENVRFFLIDSAAKPVLKGARQCPPRVYQGWLSNGFHFPLLKTYEKLLKGWIKTKKKIGCHQIWQTQYYYQKCWLFSIVSITLYFLLWRAFIHFEMKTPQGVLDPPWWGFDDLRVICFAVLSLESPPLNELGPRTWNSKIGWLLYIVAPFPRMMVVSMFEEELGFCTISL